MFGSTVFTTVGVSYIQIYIVLLLHNPNETITFNCKSESAFLFKDLYSTAPKRGSVFIGLMTPDGAIWSRYQRTVLMR